MPQAQLSLATLPLVDGGTAAAAFDEFLRLAGKDCEDRPALDKDRTVSINVKIRPQLDQHGQCDNVDVEVEVVCKGPAHKTRPYTMACKQTGAIVFHPDDPKDPHANPMFDNDQE